MYFHKAALSANNAASSYNNISSSDDNQAYLLYNS